MDLICYFWAVEKVKSSKLWLCKIFSFVKLWYNFRVICKENSYSLSFNTLLKKLKTKLVKSKVYLAVCLFNFDEYFGSDIFSLFCRLLFAKKLQTPTYKKDMENGFNTF